MWLRVAHLLEAETGFRSGDPLRPEPGGPRSGHDPRSTTLGQRRRAKAAELQALGPDEAALLGLGKVSERTLERMAAAWKGRGPAGCIDGRWVRPGGGHPSIAFEAERRRIERDLHDGAQQKLVALTMQPGLARLDLPPGPAVQAVTVAHEQAKQLMADLRDLIHGIQPQVLTDLGLPAALTELADQAPIPVAVHSALTRRLPGQAENTAYFAAAEALTNVAKHSGAVTASVTARAGEEAQPPTAYRTLA